MRAQYATVAVTRVPRERHAPRDVVAQGDAVVERASRATAFDADARDQRIDVDLVLTPAQPLTCDIRGWRGDAHRLC